MVKSFVDKICWAITTMCGVGYTPVCPGTAGSLVAVPLFMLLGESHAFTAATIIAAVLAFAFSGRAEKIFGEKDSKKIVVDDFAGMLITYLFLPCNIRFIITGFFLFRMLDMLKIPPANRIERCPGAWGVVGDDVVAGAYANILLHVARLIVISL